MTELHAPPGDPGNAVIAHTLHWLAVLLEIDDGDAAQIHAYRHAAQVVRQLAQPVGELVRTSGATSLERLGVTSAISVMVAEWIHTGELPVLSGTHKKREGLWPALTRALCKTLGIEPAQKVARPSAKSIGAARRRASGPIHRQVWESWN